MGKEVDLSYWVIRDLYIEKEKTIPQIAKSLNISVSTAYKYLKKFGFIGDEAPNTTKDDCRTCKYCGKMADQIMCSYALITDKLRNCSARHCLVREPKKRRRANE